MITNSLTESKRFIVTENKDKADAILKGVELEKTSHRNITHRAKELLLAAWQAATAEVSMGIS